MNEYIVINRTKHVSLLADHRIDPVTKELLKVGDEVCVCAVCKTVYLKHVWINIQRNTCCEQSKTLPQIPNIEYVNFEKKSDEIIQPPKKTNNAFIFFLLTTIALGILTWYWYDIYTEEHRQKEYLQQRNSALSYEISDESTKREKLKRQIRTLDYKVTNLKSSLSETKSNINRVQRLNFRFGKNQWSTGGNYDKNYLMFLEILQPIKLNYLYVKPQTKGNITVGLYTIEGVLVDSKTLSLTRPGQWNSLILNFKILEPGKYYLKRTGKVALWYDRSGHDYDQYKNDVIKILGCSTNTNKYNDQKFYQYYYDIHYSLIIEKS